MHIYKILTGVTILVLVGVVGLTGLSYFTGGFASAAVYTTDHGAISGYDAVSYFDGEPLAGSADFTTQYQGASWRFSSAKNLQRFEANPQRFVPQYGGYCAYGMSEGYTANTDPLSWTLVDDKLYLNFNQDVKADWLSERDPRIVAADDYWPVSKPALNAQPL